MKDTDFEARLLNSMIQEWGYVVGSAGLRKVLGFPTQAALRQAIARGAIPVQVFELAGRKGPFARAHDLAAWLADDHRALISSQETAAEEVRPDS